MDIMGGLGFMWFSLFAGLALLAWADKDSDFQTCVEKAPVEICIKLKNR